MEHSKIKPGMIIFLKNSWISLNKCLVLSATDKIIIVELIDLVKTIDSLINERFSIGDKIILRLDSPIDFSYYTIVNQENTEILYNVEIKELIR